MHDIVRVMLSVCYCACDFLYEVVCDVVGAIIYVMSYMILCE